MDKAMQRKVVKKKQPSSAGSSARVSFHNLPRRPVRPQVSNRLISHFFMLTLLFAVFGVICLYFMLSSQQEKMHAIRAVAAAHSASRIMSSNKPFLIYGTAWKKEKTAQHVSNAIRSGFRFIDTACQPKHYNEAGVGNGWTQAAQELNLQRSDLFLQTKFTSYNGQDPDNVPYDPKAPLEEQVKESLDVSLKNLRTTYLDSLVLHSPFQDMRDTLKVWKVFESFVDDGRVLKLGISNCYDVNKFKTVYEAARIKPWAVQNRFYADSHFDTELRTFCEARGVKYQSFWTLTANRHALASDQVKQAAAKVNLTPQTYMYAFLMSLGYITPLSGTTNKQHMAQDVAVMERLQKGQVIFKDDVELRHMAQLLGMPDL